MAKDDDEKKRPGLLDPGSFWDDQAAGEPDKPDEDDVAVVGPKDAFPPRPPASSCPPPAPRPKPGADGRAPEAELEERVSLVKVGILVLLVASVAGFLGWFLIGRHASVDEQAVEQPRQAPAGKDDQARTGKDEGARRAGLQAGADDQALEREIRAGLIEIEECKEGTGFLYVTTEPPGAFIELNGKRLPGKTPKVINDVCAGVPIELRLQAVGYRTWREEVTIEPGDIHNLTVRLER